MNPDPSRHTPPRLAADASKESWPGIEEEPHLGAGRLGQAPPAFGAPSFLPLSSNIQLSETGVLLDDVPRARAIPVTERCLVRALFVTAFRRGSATAAVATSVARACSDLGSAASEWQLGPGVIVPRQGEVFGIPVPHPSDRESFENLVRAWRDAHILVLDGPVSLLAIGDPFALSADEHLVVAETSREGQAEAYAAIKLIFEKAPDARVRVLMRHASSERDAHEAFHRISDVSARYLGRQVRSHGAVNAEETRAVGAKAVVAEAAEREGGPVSPRRGAAKLATVFEDAGDSASSTPFTRIARSLISARTEPDSQSYFDAVWTRLFSAG